MNYSNGVPGWMIWSWHILMGALFVYLGYNIARGKQVHPYFGYFLLAEGVVMILYHSSLWWKNRK